MRTALSVAALAAGALAVPYKRQVVYTDVDIVYVTDVVTVTAGQAPAAYTSASSSSETPEIKHYGHHHWPSSSSVWTSTWETTTEAAVTPTTTSTSTSVPVYTPPPSTTSTPEPETTTTTPIFQAPVSTYVPVPTTSSYVAPASSSAAPANYGSAPATYAKSVIDSHNLHRNNHSAPNVEWDDDLYQIAMEIGATCNYAHNTEMGGGGYGQNIAAGVDASSIMSVITDMFYNGEEWQFADAGLYGQANPDMSNFESWGHFTQLVWKDTTHVACYTTTTDVCPTIYSTNSDGSRGEALSSLIPPYFTVCNYKGPGNYAGEYADNVGEPLGQPIAYAATEAS